MIEELIARLEAAKGPDRELDEEIAPMRSKMRDHQTMQINWSHDHQVWVASDPARPGCHAVNTNKTKLRADMRLLQREYDLQRFLEESWDGCIHLDCLPGCCHSEGAYRCERMEQSFQEWRTRPSPATLKPVGG